MTSQLVALATQSRKPSEPDELDELDEDDEPADPHMSIRAVRQLVLPSELVLVLEVDVDVPKHVPHLAMMLSTALSHFELAGLHPAPATAKTAKKESTSPEKARFMNLTPRTVEADYRVGAAGRSRCASA
jgi:hypothetical protein